MPNTTAQHASRIETALSDGRAVRSPIAASWARSAKLHGLHPTLRPGADRLESRDLTQLRQEMGPLLSVAAPHLDHLFRSVAGLGACVVLANARGTVVDRRGKPGDDDDFERSGLWTGTDWSEAGAGTNGIGTCLYEGRAVTIHREQHFLARNIGLSCSSAPVHDARGALSAVIDVSFAKPDLPEPVLVLLGQTVTEAARKVEADLFHAAFPRTRIVLVPGTDRGLGALLAVDADDLVVGATRAARAHLRLTGDLAKTPLPLADLLGIDSHDTLDEAERAVLNRALARASGNVSAAARALGLSRATLHRKLGKS